jgi:hypothetical protein
MPRYFFDTDNDTLSLYDEEGVVLADEHAARDIATKAMGEMAKDHLPGPETQKNLSMCVRDQDGEVLMHLFLNFTIKPAT